MQSIRHVEQFLFHEARLLDERRFEEWLALFTADARYWCPCDDAADPLRQVSIFFDDAARMRERVFRLEQGPAFAQDPPSKTRRLLSNIECRNEADADGQLLVRSNFMIAAVRRNQQDLWVGQYEHLLRTVDGVFKIARKKISLVNGAIPLPTIAFLL